MLRLVLALILALFAFPAFAQLNPKAPPNPVAPEVHPKRPGMSGTSERMVGSVRVGEHAPNFSLLSAAGGQFRLKDTRGTWVALFFTSRRDDLTRLSGMASTLDSLKLRSVIVCNEKVQSLAQWYAGADTLPPLTAVADELGEISAMYGLWDRERSTTRSGLFLLDQQGVVRLALLGQEVGAPSLRGLVQSAVEGL